jgi:hypothetical protein
MWRDWSASFFFSFGRRELFFSFGFWNDDLGRRWS